MSDTGYPTWLLDRLAESYAPLPAPTQESLDFARSISNSLRRSVSTDNAGVVAVAMAGGSWFFAFSADLQRAVSARFSVRGATWCRGGGPSSDMMERVIQKASEFNPGCAEKKLLAEIWRLNPGEVETVAAAPFPETVDLNVIQNLISYIEIGSGREVFIGPCRSCKRAWAK